LSSVQWFLAMLAAAVGLTIASLLWRLPQVEAWEAPAENPPRGFEAEAADPPAV